jgi:C4-type Zn-finger protein
VSDNAAVEVTKSTDWSTSCPDINRLQKRVLTKQCMYRTNDVEFGTQKRVVTKRCMYRTNDVEFWTQKRVVTKRCMYRTNDAEFGTSLSRLFIVAAFISVARSH